MVDLFIDRVLLKNNTDQDELDTEREIVARLQNRILLLFFGCVTSESCQLFAPKLSSFFKQLTDEAYVDRSAQLVLLYIRYRRHFAQFRSFVQKTRGTNMETFFYLLSISMDETEEQLGSFLKELPKKCLFLAFEDPFRRCVV